MPMPLAGETVCGKRKDRQELGLYFPVLTTSPACPQSGDNYISHAEIKNTSIKSIYMEKGKIEPNLGWDGTPYDWTKGVTEIQTDFVDTGAEAQQGKPNLLENSSFPTLQQDRWRFIYENFDVGIKSNNKFVNSRMLEDGYPWFISGSLGVNRKSYIKFKKLNSMPEDTDVSTGAEIKVVKGEAELPLNLTQKVSVKPNTEYSISMYAKAASVIDALKETQTEVTSLKSEVDGANLILNSGTRRWANFQGTSSAHKYNVVMEEWNTKEAINVSGKGGTSQIIMTLGAGHRTEIGKWYTHSIYIRNNSPNVIIIGNNISKRVTVAPGEVTRVVMSQEGDGIQYTQFLAWVSTADNRFNFDYWHPKIEIGSRATDWSPAPEDADWLSVEVGSQQKGFMKKYGHTIKNGLWNRVHGIFKTRPGETEVEIKIGSVKDGHFEISAPLFEEGPFLNPWSPSESDEQDNSKHPSNWVYSKTPPADKSKVWGDISETRDILPKKWTGSKWESLHLLNKAQYGGEVKLISQKAGNSIQIQKEQEGIVGISQVLRFPSPLERMEYVNLSFDLEEKTRSTGIMTRVEFFDKDMQYIHSVITRTFHNIMVGKRRFNTSNMVQFKPARPESTAHYARVSFFGNQNKGRVNAAITKFKAEIGSTSTGWSLHEKETGFNLNAGQLEIPKIDGQVDRSRVISEVAILRSALGENLLSWEEVTRIKATSLKGATLHDYFIENGGYYRYALQPIMADGSKGSITGFYDVVTTLEGFWLLGQEDMQFSFIYDGKIDSINYVKPTAFIETIASRYPYAVRSTETDYRRFNFSGKLTYHQDTQRLLTSNTYTQAVSPQSTNPIGFVELKYGDEMLLECQNDLSQMQDGMVMQRIWRHKLLDWLGDGRPKILKSEAEGNMLVMIDDIQVSPVHTVYGLIADFSCSMIEIGKVDEETLQRFKLRKKEITHDDLRKSLLNEQFSLIE